MNSRRQSLTRITDDDTLIRMWLSGKGEKTKLLYRRTIKNFLEFVGVNLVDVCVEDVVQWKESLVYRNHSQNTVSLKLSIVRSLFSYAYKISYLNVNVMALMKVPPQVSAIHERFLEQEQVKKLISGAKEGRNLTLLVLIYTTGLRASEALGIDWKDLRPHSQGGQITIRMAKGGKIRTVLVNHSLWEKLQSLPRYSTTDAVFATARGNRLDRFQLHRIIKKAVEKAGVNPHISTHWLRHAHACHSLENGCDIDVLMRSLGHSSLTVTSQYLHARPNEGSSQFIDF
jgi:integrase/recombinase XerD